MSVIKKPWSNFFCLFGFNAPGKFQRNSRKILDHLFWCQSNYRSLSCYPSYSLLVFNPTVFVLSIFIPVCPRQYFCIPLWHSLPTSMCFCFPLQWGYFPLLKYVFEKDFVCFLERVCYAWNRGWRVCFEKDSPQNKSNTRRSPDRQYSR